MSEPGYHHFRVDFKRSPSSVLCAEHADAAVESPLVDAEVVDSWGVHSSEYHEGCEACQHETAQGTTRHVPL